MGLPHHPRIAEPTLRSLLLPDIAGPVGAQVTVADALRMATQAGQSALAVIDEGKTVGVFSDADAARLIAEGRTDPGAVPVGQAICRHGITLSAKTSLPQALELLSQAGLRHLPVVDDGIFLGIACLDVLLKELGSYHERVVREMELDWKILFLRGTYSC
jgi:CBS domain-containing protein